MAIVEMEWTHFLTSSSDTVLNKMKIVSGRILRDKEASACVFMWTFKFMFGFVKRDFSTLQFTVV